MNCKTYEPGELRDLLGLSDSQTIADQLAAMSDFSACIGYNTCADVIKGVRKADFPPCRAYLLNVGSRCSVVVTNRPAGSMVYKLYTCKDFAEASEFAHSLVDTLYMPIPRLMNRINEQLTFIPHSNRLNVSNNSYNVLVTITNRRDCTLTITDNNVDDIPEMLREYDITIEPKRLTKCRSVIAFYRELYGYSRTELNDLTGISPTTLDRYERGERSLLKTNVYYIMLLARVFNVTIGHLIEKEIQLNPQALKELEEEY